MTKGPLQCACYEICHSRLATQHVECDQTNKNQLRQLKLQQNSTQAVVVEEKTAGKTEPKIIVEG